MSRVFWLSAYNIRKGKRDAAKYRIPFNVSLLELVDNIADFVLDIVNRYL